jgi:hypothetical protein
MKEIMAKESSRASGGVPSFEYNPADERQPLLFELTRSEENLQSCLLGEFAGRTMSLKELFGIHNVGKPFIMRNYKDALMALEARNEIVASPPAADRRRATFGEKVLVTFPKARS